MWDQDRLKHALDYAARAHGDQRVPGSGLPYVVHVVKVASEALRACHDDRTLDPDLAVACALLHDTVEDAGVAVAQLEATFGPAVARGVAALSKDPCVAHQDRMEDCLRRVRAQPREVWVVKLADRVTNLESPPPAWATTKRRAYLEEARVIHAALGAAHPGLARRLEEKMAAYAAWC